MEMETKPIIITPPFNYINSLPNEILAMILQYTDCRDIASFGATCKRFWEMVQNDTVLWRDRFQAFIPPAMFKTVKEHCQGEWLNVVKSYYYLEIQLHDEIMAMSPKYYWQCNDVSLEDTRNFFEIALSNNVNYFYTIFILQHLIKKSYAVLYKNILRQPFTLTELYYAKIVLRYLIHTYLAVWWVKSSSKDEFPPEIVVNFFLQWIDTDNMYPESDVTKHIDQLVKKVENVLNAQNPEMAALPVQERCAKKLISERQVLNAVTQVIYHQRHMAVTAAANLDTINIGKVLKNRCGNVIVVGAIYHALARRCGVKCQMLAFPNHLIVEWCDLSDPARPQLFTVDLGNGELKHRRRCPFSHANPTTRHKYCPEALLQYIYSAFHMTMGAIRNWNTQNASHLIDFLATINHSHHNPYRNFLVHLNSHSQLSAISQPLDLTYLDNEHIQIIQNLANLNVPVKSNFKVAIVKRHISEVKYAVGMICYHRKLDYVGIIRGWDTAGDANWVDRSEIELNLRFGLAQPFYYLLAADQSNRYVAQENLGEIIRPTRLYHLEDDISTEFTHFDGFSYIPNAQKTFEYPDDKAVAGMYSYRALYRY